MNEPTKLLAQLNLLRNLLDGPTTLPVKTHKAARAVAQHLGDRCWMNAGWHLAAPDRQLRGSASTATIEADLVPLIDLLQARAKPIRGRGRPIKDHITGPDALIILEYLQDRTGKSLASVIDASILKKGLPLDKTKTTASHVKRIERIIEKLKKTHAPRPTNVLIFRLRKKRDEKSK
jgi:hypothetical protein